MASYEAVISKQNVVLESTLNLHGFEVTNLSDNKYLLVLDGCFNPESKLGATRDIYQIVLKTHSCVKKIKAFQTRNVIFHVKTLEKEILIYIALSGFGHAGKQNENQNLKALEDDMKMEFKDRSDCQIYVVPFVNREDKKLFRKHIIYHPIVEHEDFKAAFSLQFLERLLQEISHRKDRLLYSNIFDADLLEALASVRSQIEHFTDFLHQLMIEVNNGKAINPQILVSLFLNDISDSVYDKLENALFEIQSTDVRDDKIENSENTNSNLTIMQDSLSVDQLAYQKITPSTIFQSRFSEAPNNDKFNNTSTGFDTCISELNTNDFKCSKTKRKEANNEEIKLWWEKISKSKNLNTNAFIKSRDCLKDIYEVLRKCGNGLVLQNLCHCAEDNLLDFFYNHPDVLTGDGTHYIFSIRDTLDENPKTNINIQVNPPCFICCLTFPHYFKFILKTYKSFHVEIEKNMYRDINASSSSFLLQFAKWGCKKDIDAILKLDLNLMSAHINEKDNEGVSPLHHACERSNLEIVKVICSLGADINNRSNDGRTPLHRASGWSTLSVVKYICEYFNLANVELKDNNGVTPLHLSCQRGNYDITKYLIETCKYSINLASKDKGTNECLTPLNRAIRNYQEHIAKYLINKPHVIVAHCFDRFHDYDITCGFTMAVWQGYLDVVRLLLKKGVEELGVSFIKECVNRKYGDDSTILHHAAEAGNENVVSLLVKNGAAINAVNEKNETPLHMAASYGREQIIRVLFEHGADVNCRDHRGRNLLHYAAIRNRKGVLSLLLEEGFEIQTRCARNFTPMHHAVENSHYEIVEALLNFNFHMTRDLTDIPLDIVNCENINNVTPFWLAVTHRNTPIVRLLLKNGAMLTEFEGPTNKDIAKLINLTGNLFNAVQNQSENGILFSLKNDTAIINARDQLGRTPLCIAAYFCSLKIVNLLLSYDADASLRDLQSNIPFHYALDQKHADVVDAILRKLKETYNVKQFLDSHLPQSAQMPLHAAVQNAPLEIVNTLIKYGADVDVLNGLGQTPLILASHEGLLDIVNLLLENDADPTKADDHGYSALHHAVHQRHVEVVRCILNHMKDRFDIEAFLNFTSVGRVNESLLHVAVKTNSIEIVKNLIEFGSDKNYLNDVGRTPFLVAFSLGFTDIAMYLLNVGAD